MVENEDDPESWRQVAALGSMAGLLNDQRKRLELAKEALIEAWPPGKNKAAAAFVDMIDDLLFNMAENKTIADSNAGALGQVLEALRQAKVKVEPLYRSYLEKNDDWVPGWWDNAEDELDEKAREQMRYAENIVAQPDNAITAPDVYEFQPRTYIDKLMDGPDGDGFDTQATPFSTGATGGAGSGISVPHDPPPPLPGADSTGSGGGRLPLATDPTPGSAGPSLAGVISPSPSLPPPIASPVASPPVSGSAFVPTTPGLIIGPESTGGRSSVGGGQRGLPGSVIGGGVPGRGGAPSAKPAAPSWLPTGQTGARGAGSRTGTGTSMQNSMMPASQAPGSRRRSGEGGQHLAFDPDNPWATEQGVAPVIEPSRAQYRHDPGPGVIGLRQ
ncbi:hypothetical protein DMB66_57190 [Actinoplanes sp. ATCC 53533]|nr:hypothetical protein DMB66_57190 [Actinoplanes sp. ATCC 53533]